MDVRYDKRFDNSYFAFQRQTMRLPRLYNIFNILIMFNLSVIFNKAHSFISEENHIPRLRNGLRVYFTPKC